VAAGAAILLCGELTTAADKKTFTILHTNDLHSYFVGMGPALNYTPFSIGKDIRVRAGSFPISQDKSGTYARFSRMPQI
jgi:2',3'-cyclic-nucleotide 2'-phosphodiesterase (5'-nucleotidase family)